ncbi:MAG: replication initiation factor domain-containing protein, partial [Candidatus Hodarchaeales archaeon]
MEKGIVLLDTLCLNVRYPHSDIFNRWYRFIENVDRHVLRQGVEVGDFVARTGGAGYKFSLWQHDARFYLTDETDDKRGEGNGMGIRIQLGPKFLIQHINELVPVILDLLSDIGIKKEWPIHITRLDLAVDMFGVAMVNQSLKDWQENWVGRSKVSGVHFNSRTGVLETINIGSRTSAIYLRIYDKVAQALKEGDAFYWLDVWEKSSLEEVTRVEWEIKPKKGNFSNDLVDFYEFNGFSRRELMNYLMEWGRLGIPENDVNRSRWKSAPFWKNLEEIKDTWA